MCGNKETSRYRCGDSILFKKSVTGEVGTIAFIYKIYSDRNILLPCIKKINCCQICMKPDVPKGTGRLDHRTVFCAQDFGITKV